MEAARFGFDPRMPPAFKFDPTDAVIVAYYLLPRALGIPDPPFGHAVVDADPVSLPPQDLFVKHGLAGCHHAFFLDTTDMSKNGGRRERVVRSKGGGVWRGQKSIVRTVTLLHPGGGEVVIGYRRYDLTYKCEAEANTGERERDSAVGKRKRKASAKDGDPAGWVMHEYQIVSPPLHATVLSRIKITDVKLKEDRLQAKADRAAADQNQHLFVPVPDQAGPSFQSSPFAEQAGPSHHVFQIPEHPGPAYGYQVFPPPEQPGPSHHGFPVPEQPGPSYHHPAVGNQTDDPRYGDHDFDPDCGYSFSDAGDDFILDCDYNCLDAGVESYSAMLATYPSNDPGCFDIN